MPCGIQRLLRLAHLGLLDRFRQDKDDDADAGPGISAPTDAEVAGALVPTTEPRRRVRSR